VDIISAFLFEVEVFNIFDGFFVAISRSMMPSMAYWTSCSDALRNVFLWNLVQFDFTLLLKNKNLKLE